MVLTESTAAIVLRTRPIRESDLIVVMMTPEKGRVSALARGARKSQRRFGGGLAVGARGLAELEKRNRNLRTLYSFQATSLVSAIGRDLDVFAYTAYICEICEQMSAEGHGEPTAFAQACEALGKLCDEGAHPSILRSFEWGILDALGYLPTLDRCCICGTAWEDFKKDLTNATRFDLDNGGILCSSHMDLGTVVSVSLIELIRSLRNSNSNARQCLNAAEERDRRALRDVTLQLLRVHLRRPLLSLGLLSQLGGSRIPPVLMSETHYNSRNRGQDC